MGFAGIHHVTFIVDDRERAERFYGEILGLQPKSRPNFRFPGLFYCCGQQELHLIIASRPLPRAELAFEFDGTADFTRRFVHRHAAFVVDDVAEIEARLNNSGVEVLFSGSSPGTQLEGTFENIAAQGWIQMYGRVPLFCLDPFGNLLEFVPGQKLAMYNSNSSLAVDCFLGES
jgi:catechol 2,3-dioxygenase-like lactoylglutathione lyase family enzyme